MNHKIAAQRVRDLAACLELCTHHGRASLLENKLVLQLWALANSLSLASFASSTPAASCTEYDTRPCSLLVGSTQGLMSSVFLMMDVAASRQVNSSSARGGIDDSDFECGKQRHSPSAAASRAARVLQQRRQAGRVSRGPFPSDILFMLASIMQVLDTVIQFLAGARTDQLNRAARAAKFLFEDGKLLESLFLVASFLLRCVRKRQPTQHSLTADAFPPFEHIQQAAIQNLSYVVVHMFAVIYLLPEPQARAVMRRLPVRFFDVLGCLACEGLSPNDDAAWQVSHLFQDGGVTELTGHDLSMLYRPAMQRLSRRTAPSAIKRGKDLQVVLDLLKSNHPELYEDPFLSVHIRSSADWENIQCGTWGLDASNSGISCSPGAGGDDETSDAYHLPCVTDQSLHLVVDQLPAISNALLSGERSTLFASEKTIFTSNLTAVLLSLQRLELGVTEGTPSGGMEAYNCQLQSSLITVARYTTALATQLLQGLRMKHAECACEFYHADEFLEEEDDDDIIDDDDADEEDEEIKDKERRPKPVIDCEPCHALAEGMTAMLLQVMRLHSQAKTPTPSLSAAPGESIRKSADALVQG